MDVATPAGILLGFAAIIVSFMMEGGKIVAFIKIPSMLLVFGGTLGVTVASNKLTDVSGIIKATLRAVLPGKKVDTTGIVNQLMEYADIARRDGLLALEEKTSNITDPFLKRALELVVDGVDSEEVALTLEAEIEALQARHKVAAKFFADMGGFAPTMGIIGTVLGLVHALEGLADPAGLGKAISSAFVATLWGVMTANVIYLPMSNKLKRMSTTEIASRELIIQGILSIQAGVSPRAVGERLKSHLPPKVRHQVGEQQKSA